MAKSFLSILLVASSSGNALAFSSGRQSIIKRQIKDTSISLSLNNEDDDYSSTNTENRRAFLVNFAALPILTTFANNAAYARDAGKLVYGGEFRCTFPMKIFFSFFFDTSPCYYLFPYCYDV